MPMHLTLPELAAVLISLAAVFAFINYRYLRLPTTIGLMVLGLVLGLFLLAADALGFAFAGEVQKTVRAFDFSSALMEGMLSFLLFAGALHVNLAELNRQKMTTGVFATVGVLLSAFLVALFLWLLLPLLSFQLPFIYCLLFGSLIAPTDPIAVIGILKQIGADKELETRIAGESLFNDGIGVVMFMVVLAIAVEGSTPSAMEIFLLFGEEAGGGLLFGLLLGAVAFWMTRQVNNYQVEVLISLATVMGGYALAQHLHLSGPLAVVVAGLLMGNPGRKLAMSDKTREHLDNFWELIDEILNAVLFVLIGLELVSIQLTGLHISAGLIAIPLVLLARFLAVGAPVLVMRQFVFIPLHTTKILTWAGLRGGISVALALSLPPGPERDLLLTITYCVVVFSILVQGLSVERVLRRYEA